MAKSKLNFKRSITDKLSVKGILSDDATYITYMDENEIEQEAQLCDLLNAFKEQEIEFTVCLSLMKN